MSLMAEPSADGRFGEFGGRFVPETLVPACQELEAAFREAWADPAFRAELDRAAARLRRSPVDPHRVPQPRRAARASACCSSARTSTTPVRTRSTTCSARRCSPSAWARSASSPRPAPASTAWPRATAAALLGMECKVYMGAVDVERQALNVFRMKLLGAEVEAVHSGSRTLKDAVNEAMRDWVATVETTHYCLGSVMGPHPYPWMVREFHRVIGDEARAQCQRAARRRCPTSSWRASAAARTPSGIFCGFVDDRRRARRRRARRRRGGRPRRARAWCTACAATSCRTSTARCWRPSRSRPGSTIPGVGPEHSYLASIGRAEYPTVTDAEVIEAFQLLSRTEGIIPALEPAHALAWVVREAARARRARPCW